MPETMHYNIENEFTGYIPVLPYALSKYFEIIKESSNPFDINFSEIMLKDTILSQRIFAYVNHKSVANGSFVSINKAASIIGANKFKNIMLVFSLFPLFQEAKCLHLFKYSLLCASFAYNFTEKYKFINPDDAFLLGFLHDIGKIAMKNKFKEKYKRISNFDPVNHTYTVEDELSEFKFSHADISGYICKSWKFPFAVYDAVKFHHSPFEAQLQEAASIIYITDAIVDKNSKDKEKLPKVLQYMHLSDEEIQENISLQRLELAVIGEILGI